jgi:hypothetical protein
MFQAKPLRFSRQHSPPCRASGRSRRGACLLLRGGFVHAPAYMSLATRHSVFRLISLPQKNPHPETKMGHPGTPNLALSAPYGDTGVNA